MKTLILRVWARLKAEPVAVWGIVAACVLAYLPQLGVSPDAQTWLGVALSALGITIVRGKVTPWQAVQALVEGARTPTTTAVTASGEVHTVTVLVNGQPLPPAPRALGRFVQHDARSRDYPAPQTAQVASVRWQRRSPILDQGQIGSCTGNAAAGWLATDNAARKGRPDVDEALALEIYSKATHLDRVRGIYPPDDTGSSGLAAAKALVALGLTAGPYRHAFGLDHALAAMQSGPVLVGMPWLTGCDQPDQTGLIRYSGTVRGGHEILFDEVDTSRKLVWFTNSWGQSWGRSGRACMTWADFARALADHGDVTVPS